MSTNVTFGAGPFIDGNEYTGSDNKTYIYQNSCFLCVAPQDVDTIDGYPDFGLSDGSINDAITGDVIPLGAPVIIAYDADGNAKYKDCTDIDTDTVGDPKIADAPGNAINGAFAQGQTIIDFNGTLVCIPEKSDEIGPAIMVDPSDESTFPVDSGSFEKQCLVNLAGSMIGFVDSTGPHFIEDEDDEVGPNIQADPEDSSTWPTAPEVPHVLQFLCDSDGNLFGLVTASGPKKIVQFGIVMPDGNPVEEDVSNNHIISQCCPWVGEVTVDGEICYPDDHVPVALRGTCKPAVDVLGDPIAAGTKVFNMTNSSGVYAASYKVSDNFIVDINCVNAALEYLYCDGTTKCSNPTLAAQISAVGVNNYNAAEHGGVAFTSLPETESCKVFTQEIPKCGGRVAIRPIWTVRGIAGEGSIGTRYEYSVDGGLTYSTITTNGTSITAWDANTNDDDESNFNAQEYHNYNVGGFPEICTRIEMNTLSVDASSDATWQLPNNNVYYEFVQTRCC